MPSKDVARRNLVEFLLSEAWVDFVLIIRFLGQPRVFFQLCFYISLIELASILDVAPSALTVPDIDSYVCVMHTLFALEDLYGIRIVKTNGNPHVVIDALASPSARELRTHLCDWMEVSGKYHNGETSKEAYDDWRYHYPADASGYVKLPE